MRRVQVDLAEAVTEQLKDAEELEWSDAARAEGSYDTATELKISGGFLWIEHVGNMFLHDFKMTLLDLIILYIYIHTES